MHAESFRWNQWNLDHAVKHGCRPEEIEAIVRREVRANRHRPVGDEKWMVIGRGRGDRPVRVIFVLDDGIYVIHAMPVSIRR